MRARRLLAPGPVYHGAICRFGTVRADAIPHPPAQVLVGIPETHSGVYSPLRVVTP
jgi:hypothetical protein